MSSLAWMKAKTIEKLVLDYGCDLTELINKELELMKGGSSVEHECTRERKECKAAIRSSAE